MDVNFKNAIIDIFMAHTSTVVPSPEMVETIYGGTSEGSLGRRLMSDIYAYGAYADDKAHGTQLLMNAQGTSWLMF